MHLYCFLVFVSFACVLVYFVRICVDVWAMQIVDLNASLRKAEQKVSDLLKKVEIIQAEKASVCFSCAGVLAFDWVCFTLQSDGVALGNTSPLLCCGAVGCSIQLSG